MSDQMVHKIMKPDIITIGESAKMKQAADLMRNRQIRHLPVTGPLGGIVGILSDRDVRRCLDENHLVKKYMNSPILEVRAAEPIGEVAKRLLNSKVSCFLVVDEYTAPCGIVTTDDMLRYLVEVESHKLKLPIGTLFQYLKVPTYE